jgi:hypothetical protein
MAPQLKGCQGKGSSCHRDFFVTSQNSGAMLDALEVIIGRKTSAEPMP